MQNLHCFLVCWFVPLQRLAMNRIDLAHFFSGRQSVWLIAFMFLSQGICACFQSIACLYRYRTYPLSELSFLTHSAGLCSGKLFRV